MPADLAEQIPYIKQYVAAANIRVLEQVGVEADDLIASAVRCLQDGQNLQLQIIRFPLINSCMSGQASLR